MEQNLKNLKQAVLSKTQEDKKVQCNLCNFKCIIADGKLGHCFVRQNIHGTLYSLNYNKVCAATPDPIEKKPLFHFQPGSSSFSVACPGCNFKCEFCQNWHISQMACEQKTIDGQPVSPEQIVTAAIRNGCSSIAYTYTEPTIFMELCCETGKLAKQDGLANVFVSNGYMTLQAIDFAKEWLNGINVDLKAFSDDYYKRLCKARLQPVLDTIKYIAKETDIWLEVTTLLIPDQNDSDDELKKLADFIVNSAGPDVPWHISRFHPQYKYLDSVSTPLSSLQRAEQIGKQAGLRYIYPGNVPGSKSESTFCYNCGRILIERTGYTIGNNHITDSGCPDCGVEIAGYEL
ncbi:MAG: AmmeMemoRadiSam system radical SAM enzyme [Planctomycetota bacterium]|jgi:pyruvate formate lyase activating enzyme